jgi:hypothetical protein
MRKRFWTIRKNKYKHRTRKQKKPRHKHIKTRIGMRRKTRGSMKGGGELPFSGLNLGSITGSISNPMSTYIPTAGNVISSPYTWNQFTTVSGLHN